MTLHDLVHQTMVRTPDAVAVRAGGEELTYAQLDGLANQLAWALQGLGVGPGDRVGLWLDKSVRAAAAMLATLRLGAAYVPLDPVSPARRVKLIVEDCGLSAMLVLEAAAGQLQAAGSTVPTLAIDGTGWPAVAALSTRPVPAPGRGEDDLAFILYTSGSTGTPKGVCLSHRNALAFIEWAAGEIGAVPADRFSNHAPFFFDLSVLDLYVPWMVGGSVSLIPESMSFAPKRLVEFIASERITIWYSVPSALSLMIQQGELLARDVSSLRVILFAGEPCPLKTLRQLREGFPRQRLLNLYGPTETNVCTFHEVGTISPERIEPVPIGKACSGDRVWHVPVEGGAPDEGELMVEGPTVMLGYWGRPPQDGRP